MAEMVKFPSQFSELIFVALMWSIFDKFMMFYVFSMIMTEPLWDLPSGWLVAYVVYVGMFT
jgi:hypothetical protein